MALNKDTRFDTQLFPGKVEVWAELEGVENKIDLVSAVLYFTLNDIPHGQLQIAVGRDATTLRPSPAHTKELSQIKSMEPIKVFCKLTPENSIKKNTPSEIPKGTFLIFDGYTAGPVGLKKSIAGSMSLSLGIVGWVQDLHYTSIASPILFPDAPENLFRKVGTDLTDLGHLITIAGLPKMAKDLPEDVWGTLKKIFLKLAESESILDKMVKALGKKNKDAIAALYRFAVEETITSVKMSLAAEFTVNKIPHAMTQALMYFVFSSISGASIWSKLIQIVNLFYFDVVTTPAGAAIVPHYPVIKHDPVSPEATAFATIHASEQFSIDMNPTLPQHLAALWLIRNSTMSVTDATDVDPEDFGFIIGASDKVISTSKDGKGMLLIKMLPAWLTEDLAPLDLHGDLTAQPGDVPNAGGNINKNKKAKKKEGGMVIQANGQGNLLADMLFYREQLKMRTGQITGKIRFDIGPGSAVIIEGTGLPSIGYTPLMAADVTQVILSFEALGPSASTTFVVSHIRTENEFQAGLEKNPIYEEKWNGTELIKAPENA